MYDCGYGDCFQIKEKNQNDLYAQYNRQHIFNNANEHVVGSIQNIDKCFNCSHLTFIPCRQTGLAVWRQNGFLILFVLLGVSKDIHVVFHAHIGSKAHLLALGLDILVSSLHGVILTVF